MSLLVQKTSTVNHHCVTWQKIPPYIQGLRIPRETDFISRTIKP